MFSLKFNKENTTEQELTQIEKRFKEYLNDKQFVGGPEMIVLNLCRTDLFALVLSIFIRLDIHTTLKLNVDQVLDFLMDVAEKYTQAPYHSFYHATDIVNMLYYLIKVVVVTVPPLPLLHHDDSSTSRLLMTVTNLDVAFLMVAALCHDMGHPGLNNAFQKNTKSELAIKYNEKSILEAYSVDLTIHLLKKHNIQHPQLNDTIGDLILSTDMEFHANVVSQQKQLINSSNNNNNNKTTAGNNKLSLSRILLHAADVSNMARPWHISKQWSNLIVQEFFNQGDQERQLNLIISPGMDRRVSTQKKISLKFGEIIFPFFEFLVRILPKSQVLLDFLASNHIKWAQQVDCPSSSSTTATIVTTTTTITTTRKRKYQEQQPEMISRRISSSSDITTTPATTLLQQQQPIVIRQPHKKRVRLGHRSLSFPTILLHHQSAAAAAAAAASCFCGNSINNNNRRRTSTKMTSALLFPPLVYNKAPTSPSSSLYDTSTTNNFIDSYTFSSSSSASSSTSIVLCHPHDQ